MNKRTILAPALMLLLSFVVIAIPCVASAAITIDLNEVSANVTIYGDDAGDSSGSSVSSGDINGDGIADIIIGANCANTAGGTLAGETYVIFGSADMQAEIDLNSVSADVTIYGDDTHEHSGLSVSSGDINDDGIDDIIIGASHSSHAGRFTAGVTYVIFGNANMPAEIDLNAVSANVTIYGDDADDRSGQPVSSGDINGDGIADIIIGARYADTAGGDEAGEIYVIYGSASMPAEIDLDSVSANVTIYGDDKNDYLGSSVSSGDVNDDGIADVIIGASYANPAGGADAGETYLIYGSASMPAEIDLNAVSANVTIYGDDADDHSGCSVSSGDVNGDGIVDVIIGAPGVPGAYVIYGSASMPAEIDLNTTSADVTICGDYLSGRSVSSGDINGDGIADVIIGAPGAYPTGGIYAGETYVIYGSASMPAEIDLNSVSANVTIYGDDAYDHSGWSVSSGDINHDGADDVIIGASDADPAGGENAGETYVIYGSKETEKDEEGLVEWHLRRDAASGFNYPAGHEYDKIMTREAPTASSAQWVKFGPGNESWWYANNSAGGSLTCPAGDWNVTFLTKLDNTTDNGKSLTVYLWRLFENGTAAEIVNKSEVVAVKGEKRHNVTMSANGVDFNEGERVAVSFSWASDAVERVWIGCDSTARDSKVTAPSGSPAWPIPEFPTIVLLAIGLVVLVGYVKLKFKNQRTR